MTSIQGCSSAGGAAHMPISPAKSKDEWLADVEGITSKTERAKELASILTCKSKRLSEVQVALNQALSALDERSKELVIAKQQSSEANREWELTAATAQNKSDDLLIKRDLEKLN